MMRTLAHAVCLLWLSSVASAADRRPNILFIMSDDHACNAISAFPSRVGRLLLMPLASVGSHINLNALQ
ncbi:MAG: hypothetical protein H8E66_20975 [Planctomycetes bacterium]|nr:hypothetical protein [Planctomycetota bacterium]